MCEIQLVKKLQGKIDEQDISEFHKLMCYGSFRNRDAFGIFNNNMYMKTSGTYKPQKYQPEKLKAGDFIVGHNRLATGFYPDFWEPKSKEDESIQHHPFVLGDFTLVHNGIISNESSVRKRFNIQSKIKTDSFVIVWLINHFFNRASRNLSRIKRLTLAIQKTTKVIYGSYSVFVYDEIGKNLIHFRNSNTEFYFSVFNKNTLCGSTNIDNLDFVYFGKSRKYILSEPNQIYLIGNTKSPLIKLAKFEDKKIFSNANGKYHGNIVDRTIGKVLDPLFDPLLNRIFKWIDNDKYVYQKPIISYELNNNNMKGGII